MTHPPTQPDTPLGRPTILTPELTTEIRDYIRGGMTQREAAQRAGIHEGTFRRWIAVGRNYAEHHQTHNTPPPNAGPNDHHYATFFATIMQARAEAEGLFIGVIREAARNAEWKAAAWWLERSIPERWGKRDHMTLAGDSNEPVTVQIKFDDGPKHEPDPGERA